MGGSADNWDAHWGSFGAAASNNPADRYRDRLILRKLGRLRDDERLLDIGSGQGEFVIRASLRNPTVVACGLEYSETGVDRARHKASKLGVKCEFFQRDLLVDERPDADRLRWASVAVCSEVLEHVDDPIVLLRNAIEYLQPQCRVVVTVPGGPRSAFDRHIGHRRHFDRHSLLEVLRGAGLEDIAIQCAGFPFFNLYRLVVIARGRALINDLDHSAPSSGWRSRLLSAAMRVFQLAFKLNLDDSPFGWQLVASAVVPHQPRSETFG